MLIVTFITALDYHESRIRYGWTKGQDGTSGSPLDHDSTTQNISSFSQSSCLEFACFAGSKNLAILTSHKVTRFIFAAAFIVTIVFFVGPIVVAARQVVAFFRRTGARCVGLSSGLRTLSMTLVAEGSNQLHVTVARGMAFTYLWVAVGTYIPALVISVLDAVFSAPFEQDNENIGNVLVLLSKALEGGKT